MARLSLQSPLRAHFLRLHSNPSSKEPGKGPLSHLAYIFREMAPSPIPSQREVSSTPGFLPSGHYPPLPEGPLGSFPPLSILSLDQAPPRLLLPIQPVPNRKALSLGSHRSPLTLPSSKRKQTKPALPPGVHCIPTARLVLASGVGVGDLPGVPKQPLGNKASSESPQPFPRPPSPLAAQETFQSPERPRPVVRKQARRDVRQPALLPRSLIAPSSAPASPL